MSDVLFARFVSPEKFGALLDPPVSPRTIYRWIRQPDGLPITTLPSPPPNAASAHQIDRRIGTARGRSTDSQSEG